VDVIEDLLLEAGGWGGHGSVRLRYTRPLTPLVAARVVATWARICSRLVVVMAQAGGSAAAVRR
jgi:hypothetical protein